MPLLPFTLRQLEVFSSLSATCSFRRTAEELGITQASVSSQIKSFEQQMGVEFFDRSPGCRPSLRPEAIAFQDDLRAFERAAGALAAHRRSDPLQPPVSSRFKALVGQGMFDTYIRRKLDQFYARYPNVEIEFESQLPFGHLVRDAESGQYDFALINQRFDSPAPPGFRQVATVRGGVYGHVKFLEGRDPPLSVKAINRLPFILPTAASRQEREVMTNYASFGIAPRQVAGYTQYYDVIAAMLERGLGVASFSDALLTPATREQVVLLFPTQNWRLLWYRRPNLAQANSDDVEEFLLGSIVNDPSYPRTND